MKYLRQLRSALMALALMAGVAAAQPQTNGPNGRIPEPAALTLIALGAAGVAWRFRKRNKQ